MFCDFDKEIQFIILFISSKFINILIKLYIYQDRCPKVPSSVYLMMQLPCYLIKSNLCLSDHECPKGNICCPGE